MEEGGDAMKGLLGEPFDQSKIMPFGNFGKAKATD
jgi:hypothetical protein